MNASLRNRLLVVGSVALTLVLLLALLIFSLVNAFSSFSFDSLPDFIYHGLFQGSDSDEPEFELADVTRPTDIQSYFQGNELQMSEYANRFPSRITPMSTKLVTVPRKQENVMNILAICTDEENGNVIADMMLVVTFYRQTGEIRVLSLGSDTYVPIKGWGWDKLSSTIAYGGPELAVNTVNSVFDMDIADYVVLAKSDIRSFFEQVAPLEVEMDERQAEIFRNYFGWETNPGLNELDAKQLTAMVSFRDYQDGVSVDGEVIMITDADRMEHIKMVARAIYRSLYHLDFRTVSATLNVMWNYVDTNCSVRTVRDGLRTLMATTGSDRLNLTSSSLPSLGEAKYIIAQPEGYASPTVATIYNYELLRTRLQSFLYGASDNN